MLESLRKHAVVLPRALPRVPALAWLTAATVGSFAWLLLHNQIHPVVVYALQVYLTF